MVGWLAGEATELLPTVGLMHGFKGDVEEKAEEAMIGFFDKHLKK